MNLKKNLSSPFAWCVSSIILGILLIVFNEDMLRWLFYLLGITILTIGLVPIVTAITKKQELPVVSFLYVIGGVLVIVMNNSLSAILFVLLGVMLMLAGIQHIVSFININRVTGVKIPFANYIIPILCIIGGAVAIANPFAAQKTLIIYIGVVILLEGIYNLFSLTTLYRKHKQEMKGFFSRRKQDAEDATIVDTPAQDENN